MLNKVPISMCFLNQAVKQGWIPALSLFYGIKLRHANGCLFDYAGRMDEIGKSFGISRRTLYNYVNTLISKGLLHKHYGNLCTISQRPYLQRRKLTLQAPKDATIQEIEALLYSKLIEEKARRLAIEKSIERFEQAEDGKKSISAATRFFPSMSQQLLGRLMNLSQRKVVKVIDLLNQMGVIRTVVMPVYRISTGQIPPDVVEEYRGHLFTTKNGTFLRPTYRYECIANPAYIKPLTLRQYKALRRAYKRY